MTTSPKAARFDDCTMWLELNDGRTLGVPLAWFPRLLSATRPQLEQYELSAHGIHWDELDEDLSVDGLLAGRGDMTNRPARPRDARQQQNEATVTRRSAQLRIHAATRHQPECTGARHEGVATTSKPNRSRPTGHHRRYGYPPESGAWNVGKALA